MLKNKQVFMNKREKQILTIIRKDLFIQQQMIADMLGIIRSSLAWLHYEFDSNMIITGLTGIRVFATGGLGGVHRGAEHTFDISADLQELANIGVAVVCADVKSILDYGISRNIWWVYGF